MHTTRSSVETSVIKVGIVNTQSIIHHGQLHPFVVDIYDERYIARGHGSVRCGRGGLGGGLGGGDVVAPPSAARRRWRQ